MPLHLQKLCVGCDSPEELGAWIAERLARHARSAGDAAVSHTTRMAPSRRDEVLDGGSLYWVIGGSMCVRQRITDLRQVIGEDGISRCMIVLDPGLVAVEPVARRPFQGWRYLTAADAPTDIDSLTSAVGLPDGLVRELRQLGVW